MSVTYRLTAATPTSVGWYDPGEIDTRFYIRPASLKGVWRWWTRAIVAGLLYEAGTLTCDRAGRCKANISTHGRNRELDMSTILGYLGLGSGGEHSSVSRFTVIITKLQDPKICNESERLQAQRKTPQTTSELMQLQRVRLLNAGRRDGNRKRVKFFIGGLFELELRESLPKITADNAPLLPLDIDTAKELLLIALTLGGVGKGSRRGLGSLDVRSKYHEGYELRPLLNKVREKIAQNLGITPKSATGGRIPPVTLISEQNTEIYTITCNTSKRDDPCGVSEALKKVHNFFVHSERLNVLHRDMLREGLFDWVLGLPRQLRKRRQDSKQNAGYISNVKRRASPLILSYHSDHIVGSGQERLYLTVIKSADWPQKIRWRNSTTRNITVTEADIIQAVNTAVETLREYLNIGGCRMTKIWP